MDKSQYIRLVGPRLVLYRLSGQVLAENTTVALGERFRSRSGILIRCILTTSGLRQGPPPGLTRPAWREWLTWRCSLDSCCNSQHVKRQAVFSAVPPRSVTQVAFDSSTPDSADGLGSRVGACTSQRSSCGEGCKMLNHASLRMERMFIPAELQMKDPGSVTSCDKSTEKDAARAVFAGFFVACLVDTQSFL